MCALPVAEFFAGIGLARLGLEAGGFDVVWSNDIDPAKHAMYTGHFADPPGTHRFVLDDIAHVTGGDLPAGLALAWASFPCTDLSLAGYRAGLSGRHSGTFWQFTRVLEQMGARRPPVVALENVVGFATSHDGKDLVAAIAELNRLGYGVDVLTLDARRFVPQSRPRLFLVGTVDEPAGAVALEAALRPDWLSWVFDEPGLRTHRAPLPAPPPLLPGGLSALAERLPADDLRWWDADRTAAFMALMSPGQTQRLEALRGSTELTYRTAFRRTRCGVAVWEIRPDDISGCLRTAGGGSSKQALVEAGGGRVRVRWLTGRECARLMGAGGFTLDGLRYNQILSGFGDAVCVPAVGWLAQHYLLPLATGVRR